MKTNSGIQTRMTLARGTDCIESERLILRGISENDLEFLVRLHAAPNVAIYLGPGRPRSSEETLTWLRSTLWTYENLALGQLVVLRKSDGLLIGRCGLSDVAVEIRPAVGAVPRAWYDRSQAPGNAELVFDRELGYTLDPSCWGRGYASEAAGRVFDYACDVLRLSRVISLIHPDNIRSLRVAHRFGRGDGAPARSICVALRGPTRQHRVSFQTHTWL
jgi:RimJ/RimL family protein N-acetyltransferase